jgi:hypothetical protein
MVAHMGSYPVVDRTVLGIAVVVDSKMADRHRVVGR